MNDSYLADDDYSGVQSVEDIQALLSEAQTPGPSKYNFQVGGAASWAGTRLARAPAAGCGSCGGRGPAGRGPKPLLGPGGGALWAKAATCRIQGRVEMRGFERAGRGGLASSQARPPAPRHKSAQSWRGPCPPTFPPRKPSPRALFPPPQEEGGDGYEDMIDEAIEDEFQARGRGSRTAAFSRRALRLRVSCGCMLLWWGTLGMPMRVLKLSSARVPLRLPLPSAGQRAQLQPRRVCGAASSQGGRRSSRAAARRWQGIAGPAHGPCSRRHWLRRAPPARCAPPAAAAPPKRKSPTPLAPGPPRAPGRMPCRKGRHPAAATAQAWHRLAGQGSAGWQRSGAQPCMRPRCCRAHSAGYVPVGPSPTVCLNPRPSSPPCARFPSHVFVETPKQ
jgi:hypothetical protein